MLSILITLLGAVGLAFAALWLIFHIPQQSTTWVIFAGTCLAIGVILIRLGFN